MAGGRGGILGTWGDVEPGGSGARRTGWRGAKVSWETLGLDEEPAARGENADSAVYSDNYRGSDCFPHIESLLPIGKPIYYSGWNGTLLQISQ